MGVACRRPSQVTVLLGTINKIRNRPGSLTVSVKKFFIHKKFNTTSFSVSDWCASLIPVFLVLVLFSPFFSCFSPASPFTAPSLCFVRIFRILLYYVLVFLLRFVFVILLFVLSVVLIRTLNPLVIFLIVLFLLVVLVVLFLQIL